MGECDLPRLIGAVRVSGSEHAPRHTTSLRSRSPVWALAVGLGALSEGETFMGCLLSAARCPPGLGDVFCRSARKQARARCVGGPVSSVLVSRMRGCRVPHAASDDPLLVALAARVVWFFVSRFSSASLPAARAQTTVALKFVQLNTKE